MTEERWETPEDVGRIERGIGQPSVVSRSMGGHTRRALAHESLTIPSSSPDTPIVPFGTLLIAMGHGSMAVAVADVGRRPATAAALTAYCVRTAELITAKRQQNSSQGIERGRGAHRARRAENELDHSAANCYSGGAVMGTGSGSNW
eukprot:gene3320-biopygen8667